MNFNAETRTSYLLEQILVTPDMAARFLEKNLISNRKISPTRVSKLAAAMQSGDFIIGDPLKFDKNDVLIDGQHRLTALIKARVTIEFLVIKGYDERVSTVLDIGAQRSCADIARLSGYQEITATHIAIFNGMILQHITSRCANYLSKHEIIDLTSKYFNSIVFSMQLSNGRASISKACVLGAIARAHAFGVEEKILANFIRILQGEGSSQQFEQNVIRFREQCLTNQKTGLSNRYTLFLTAQHCISKYSIQYSKKWRLTPLPSPIHQIPDLDEQINSKGISGRKIVNTFYKQ